MIYSFKEGTGKKGWIIIVHGLGEHIGRYKKLIEDLLKEDFGVLGFDLPGHGKSSGKRGDTCIEEVIKVIDNLTRDISQFFILGHSLGGLIAIRYTQERKERIKSLIVSAPALFIRVDLGTKIFANILGRILPSFTMDNRLNVNFLSRNKEAVEKYVKDVLVHKKISLRLGLSMMKNIEIAHKKASEISSPTLILLPTDDKIVPSEGARRFFDSLKAEKKELIEFSGGFHELFEDEEHSEKFYKTIYKWLNSLI